MHTQTHAWQDVIKRSDKARLYQYRITDECYHELQAHLIAHRKQLSDIQQARRHGLDKAFVLYAAEWWRREYDGDWGWQQLLSSIGLDADDISSQDRVTLTENGLRKWGLAIRKTYNEQGHARRNALGSFLVEGGLPIHFINASHSANNWLMTLLDRALDALALDQDPWIVIQDYQMRLPKSARHDDVLRLLTTLAKDIHQLVDVFGLDQHIDTNTDPIAYLNQRNPDWADSLALHLGNQAASELLNKLLVKSSQTVKHLKEQSSKNQSKDSKSASDFFSEIALVRHLSLVRTQDGSYDVSLHGKIANPRTIQLDSTHSDALQAENYYLKFGNKQDDDVGYWSARYSYSRNQLILDGSRPIALAESVWTDAVSLNITDATNAAIPGLSNLIQLPSMMPIPTDAPFLAQIENDDDGYEARYIGSYSQACRDDEVLVYIPSALEHTKAHPTSTRLEKLASLQRSGLDGCLYLLSGEIRLGDGNTRYTLRSGIKDARHQYTLIGRQHPDFCYPAQVFLGDFYIQRRSLDDDQSTSQIISKKDIYIRDKQGLTYRKLSDIDSSKLFGSYHVIVKNTHNEVVFGARIGIVPKDFSYKSKSKSNTTDGILCFHQAHIIDISCDNADIAISRASEPGCFRLIASHQIPKGKLTLSLMTPSAGMLKLQCYFPSNAVYICDADGSPVSANTHFCLDDDLDGYRLNIISTSPLTDPTLYFQLESNKNYGQSLSLATHDRHYLQIPLYGFVDYAKSLLQQSPKGLDETVQVLLGHSVQPLCSFSYYHYQLDLDAANHRLYLVPNRRRFQYAYREPEQELLILGNAVSLTAVNFCDPTDCRTLTRCDNLFWDLTDLHDSQDIWFIYPHHEGSQKIRPIAYKPSLHSNQASTAVEPLGTLGLAAKLDTTQERQNFIAQTLKAMTYDFDHDGWAYIHAMAQACPDAALISFDHFKVARDCPEFLVAAQCVFKNKPLAKEVLDQIHPIWSLMTIDGFNAVLQTYRAYRSSHQSHSNNLDDDGNQQAPCQLLKLPELLKTQPICQQMFEMLTQQDNTNLNLEFIKHFINELLFEPYCINTPKTKEPIDDRTDFAGVVNAIYQTIPDDLRPTPKNWNKDIWRDLRLVYYTPIVLAWLSNHPNDALRHKLLALPNLHLDISTIQNSTPSFFAQCYHACLIWFYRHRI